MKLNSVQVGFFYSGDMVLSEENNMQMFHLYDYIRNWAGENFSELSINKLRSSLSIFSADIVESNLYDIFPPKYRVDS